MPSATSQPGQTSSPFRGFFFHLHPRKISAETIRLTLSFGLGGMAATLFVILAATGILQLLSYSFDTTTAYQSIIVMYAGSSLAGFIRNIHHWAGNLLVLISFLHLLRVYLTGALREKRKLNWLIGITLFLLILFANFTGYLLPWDQLAYWAVTILTNMVGYVPLIGSRLSEILRGGSEVGPATLANFFAIHVGLIPALMVVLLIYHFWLIRKAEGLVRASQQDQPTRMVATVPTLISREAAVGLGLTAVLFMFAALIDAPLADIANPGESPNPAKAAWYFMGLQELLLHFHPTFAICLIPLLMIVLTALLPFIKGAPLEAGVWCGGLDGKRLAGMAFLGGIVSIFLLVIIDDNLLKNGDATQTLLPWMSRGIVPLTVLILVYCGLYLLLKKKNYQRSACVMAVVLVNTGLVCGLTIIGIWFRGAGMALTF